IAVTAFAATALLSILAITKTQFKTLLGYLLIAISLIPLVALFSKSMWIESLGGFPIIGSGQGVIKYAALLSIGVLLLSPNISNTASKWIAVFPVLLVLVWIGGMKFMAFEAKGIETLVQSSPLMAWMYLVWDLQTTSNIIGIYDLVAAVLLIIAIYNRRFLIPAILMSGAVFVVTQTFLFSWAASTASDTLLTTGGHFLIKDLWFVSNLLLFWQISKENK
ncbi:MAG: DUF417 family protein, partial [Gammaproteobacteria bacterium]|nr:DUF417 family protein [Gammaproteobacteria bacterium]